MTVLILNKALPTIVYADLGQQISLAQVLNSSFGALGGTYQDYRITYFGAQQLAANNLSYWDLSHKVASSWKIEGQDIGPGNDTYVAASNLGRVSISAGTDIAPWLWLDIRTQNDPANLTYDRYEIQSGCQSLSGRSGSGSSNNCGRYCTHGERFRGAGGASICFALADLVCFDHRQALQELLVSSVDFRLDPQFFLQNVRKTSLLDIMGVMFLSSAKR